MPVHFVDCQAIVNQHQGTYHLPDRTRTRSAIRHARVRKLVGMQPEEIRVVGHQDTMRSVSESQLFLVGGCDESDLLGCGHINAALPQSACDCFFDIFVKVKANHGRYPFQPTW